MTELHVTARPKRRPTHPGEVLREDVLPSLHMTVRDVAGELGVTRQTLHAVLSGEQRVSVEMALRLGKFCGNGPTLWVNMQAAYDLWESERAMSEELARIPTHKSS
jgi:addiction module HigA family antidote